MKLSERNRYALVIIMTIVIPCIVCWAVTLIVSLIYTHRLGIV